MEEIMSFRPSPSPILGLRWEQIGFRDQPNSAYFPVGSLVTYKGQARQVVSHEGNSAIILNKSERCNVTSLTGPLGETALMMAVVRGNAIDVGTFASSSTKNNVLNEPWAYEGETFVSGTTALMMAAQMNKANVIRIILKAKGKEINFTASNEDSESALTIACLGNHVESVEVLSTIPKLRASAEIGRGVKRLIDVFNNSDRARAILSCLWKWVPPASMYALFTTSLIGQKVAVANQMIREHIPKEVRVHLLKEVAEVGIRLDDSFFQEFSTNDANQTDAGQQTALMTAAKSGNVEFCHWMIQRFGSDQRVVNFQNARGWTALHAAIVNTSTHEKHLDVVRELVESGGANLLLKTNRSGSSPLLAALSHQRSAVALYLVDSMKLEDVVSPINGDGWTVLMFAARSGQTDVADRLLDKGVSPDTKETAHGFTALMIAVQYSQRATAAALMRPVPDLSSHRSDKTGVTLLMLLCQNGWMDLVVRALKKNSDINAVTTVQHNAYWYALRCDHPTDLLRFLIGSGVNVSSDNSDGLTVAARSQDGVELIQAQLECIGRLYTNYRVAESDPARRDDAIQAIVVSMASAIETTYERGTMEDEWMKHIFSTSPNPSFLTELFARHGVELKNDATISISFGNYWERIWAAVRQEFATKPIRLNDVRDENAWRWHFQSLGQDVARQNVMFVPIGRKDAFVDACRIMDELRVQLRLMQPLSSCDAILPLSPESFSFDWSDPPLAAQWSSLRKYLITVHERTDTLLLNGYVPFFSDCVTNCTAIGAQLLVEMAHLVHAPDQRGLVLCGFPRWKEGWKTKLFAYSTLNKGLLTAEVVETLQNSFEWATGTKRTISDVHNQVQQRLGGEKRAKLKLIGTMASWEQVFFEPQELVHV